MFYSAYIPVAQDSRLPALNTPPPLLRETSAHQADWLLRFYDFSADEILGRCQPQLRPLSGPQRNWAIQHLDQFPVDVNRADRSMLLRVPGIGPKSVRRIVQARRQGALGLEELRRMGVVLKRAQYFICCKGFSGAAGFGRRSIAAALVDSGVFAAGAQQLSLFAPDLAPMLSAGRPGLEAAKEEAVSWIEKRM